MLNGSITTRALFSFALFPLIVGTADADALREGPPPSIVWDAGSARHLLERAGLGPTPAELRDAVAAGQVATVEGLFAPRADSPPPPWLLRPLGERGLPLPPPGSTSPAEFTRDIETPEVYSVLRLYSYADWWLGGMLEGRDPLRDRMTLFWHGYFPSSMKELQVAELVVRQHMLLRGKALGHFGDILRGVARDPAMLRYLNNEQNVRDWANENWARELFELFALGEGRYDEDDVHEVARAFTGWTLDNDTARFESTRHDPGRKRVLGRTGLFRGDDIIDLLLEDEDCARYLAGRLIAYLEGQVPSEARLAKYAEILLASDYDVASFLRELFLDPEFYRAEVRGVRVRSPVDQLVALCRALELRPPGTVIHALARPLGEHLFYPPNVKGWCSGPAWVHPGVAPRRGDAAAVLLGILDPLQFCVPQRDKRDPTAVGALADKQSVPSAQVLAFVAGGRGLPATTIRVQLLEQLGDGPHDDGTLVDALATMLLVVPPSPERRALITRYLSEDRKAAGMAPCTLLADDEQAEPLLRNTAHLLACLPEAQLH